MEEGKSVYDLLAEDVDFARTVNAVYKSVTELAEVVEQTRTTATDQAQTAKDATALLASVTARVEEMKTLSVSLDAKLEEMQRLAESYDGAFRAYENLKAVYDAFDSRLKALESGKQAATPAAPVAPTVPVQPKPTVPATKKFTPLPGVDYTEVTSVAKLFAKYKDKINGPIIIVRTKTYPWGGDYCMVVKSVNHGKAWGVRYKHGEVNSNRPVNAEEEDYSMYHGDNYWTIVADYEKQISK